jgi:hypothetical protein
MCFSITGLKEQEFKAIVAFKLERELSLLFKVGVSPVDI